jgi:hypothetical protein
MLDTTVAVKENGERVFERNTGVLWYLDAFIHPNCIISEERISTHTITCKFLYVITYSESSVSCIGISLIYIIRILRLVEDNLTVLTIPFD